MEATITSKAPLRTLISLIKDPLFGIEPSALFEASLSVNASLAKHISCPQYGSHYLLEKALVQVNQSLTEELRYAKRRSVQ